MAALLAFTTEHVQRLTGLTPGILRHWEDSGVFRASFVDERPRRAYRRLYTFRDVVSLRTLALLRREHRVGLDELRKVGMVLAQHIDPPWPDLRIRVAGRHVLFNDLAGGDPVAAGPVPQGVILIDLAEIARETEAEAARLRKRLPADIGRVTRHQYVNHNAWVLAGTRIPTSAIWDFHEAGYSPEEIIREYPDLSLEDVEAAICHERQMQEHLAA